MLDVTTVILALTVNTLAWLVFLYVTRPKTATDESTKVLSGWRPPWKRKPRKITVNDDETLWRKEQEKLGHAMVATNAD